MLLHFLQQGESFGMDSLTVSTVTCSIRKAPLKAAPFNFMSSLSSFKPVFRRLQQQFVSLKVEVPKIIKTASLNLLDGVVDSLFEFEEQAVFNEGNFAPVDEVGEALQLSVTDGEIPDDFPEGIYFRTGPNHLYPNQTAAVSIFGRTGYTWVEGDGMLHATYFSKDDEGNWKVSYKNKYVESETFLMEKNRNKKMFIPAADGDPTAILAAFVLNMMRFGKAVKDDSNTNVFEHAGKLYAVSEQYLPYEIDASDLHTLKAWDVNGAWHHPFTSHPKKAPHTGEMVIMGVDIKRPHYILGIISADGGEMLHKVDLKFRTGTLVHELGVTENYNIIMDYPLRFGINRVLAGKSFIGYDGDGESRIGVMPRFGDAESISWFTVRNHCSFHIINSFEDGDEVVVRGCRTTGSVIPGPDHKANKAEWYRRAYLQPNEDTHSFDPAMDGVLFSRPYQWRLNMRTGAVKEGYLTGKEIAMDFPAINLSFTGLRNRYAYAQVVDSEASSKLGLSKYNMLAKLHFGLQDEVLKFLTKKGLMGDEELAKVEYHELGDGEYCTGAQFVQKQEGTEEEDDGWLLCYVHDERSNISKVYVIDAKRFTEEPVAKISLPRRVPYGFHACYMYE